MPQLGDYVVDYRIGGHEGIVVEVDEEHRSLVYVYNGEKQWPVSFSAVYVRPIVSIFTRFWWNLNHR